MQRLAYLTLVCSLAPTAKGTSLAGLASELGATVSRKVKVDLSSHPELIEYIRDRRLFATRYRSVKDWLDKAVEPPPSLEVELQDLYLSQRPQGAATGNLTPDVFSEIPRWAEQLNLVRPGNYSLSGLGKVLLLLSPKSLDHWRAYSSKHNPFLLDDGQKMFFLYVLIANDADVLARWYSRLSHLQLPFDRSQAGDLLSEVFREVYETGRKRVRTAGDEVRLRSLLQWASKIESRRGKPMDGTGRTREQRSTARLETMVDLGLLRRTSPTSYKYITTTEWKSLVDSLEATEDWDAFLSESFFQMCTRLFGMKAKQLHSPEQIVVGMGKTYGEFVGTSGYAPIEELLLLHSIRLLNSRPACHLELSTGKKALKAMQKWFPRLVQFTVDRQGRLRYVRLQGRLLG